MNEITLEGCTATSLAEYLKALGILRLLSSGHPETRGAWRGDRFVLTTLLTREEIEAFFLNDYVPTPIISPWSGRAGFLEGDDGQGSKRKGALILDRIANATGKRFEQYRQTVSAIRNVSVIRQLDRVRADRKRLEALKNKALNEDGAEQLSEIKRLEEELKGALLRALRNELDDPILPWLDACFALTGDDRTPGPLLGSGGNEGSMDFSINHVGYLLELIDEGSDEATPLARRLIGNSLFAYNCPRESSSNIGFLDTLATGGANMTAGYEGSPSGNIWDSVFALEGAILFASLSTRRLESTASGRPTFPFSVAASFAGGGSLAAKESARPELWLPLWSAAATTSEVAALLAEGRTTKGRREARNGVDMLQAIASLGVDRGIVAFNRFGFYERRGLGYYVATHLGRYDVPEVAADNWVIDELNQRGWLDAFRGFTSGDNTPARYVALRKRLEDRLFALSGKRPNKAEIQSLLALLAEIQLSLGVRAEGKPKGDEKLCPPVPLLSQRWVSAADDQTPAFRIAKAVAGLRGNEKVFLPARAQIFPMHPRSGDWMVEARKAAAAAQDPLCRLKLHGGIQRDLIDLLTTLLQRRLSLIERLAMEDKPLASAAGATLEDIAAFLRDDSMDSRIRDLLLGLVLCDIPEDKDRTAGDAAVPAAFALMKLAMTPERTLRSLGVLPEGQRLPVPTGMLAQLIAGNSNNRAAISAWRCLLVSGLRPLFTSSVIPGLAGLSPERTAAALLIPLRFGATAALTRAVLKQPKVALI